MGSKNISISEAAYTRLRRARKHPRESFSQVIQRGTWDSETPTGQDWLMHMHRAPPVDDQILDALEHDQQNDPVPEDKWTS